MNGYALNNNETPNKAKPFSRQLLLNVVNLFWFIYFGIIYLCIYLLILNYLFI